MDFKNIMDTLIAFVIFIVIAIVFMVVMLFIFKVAAVLVFGGDATHYAGEAILATGLIVGASLVGGGALFRLRD